MYTHTYIHAVHNTSLQKNNVYQPHSNNIHQLYNSRLQISNDLYALFTTCKERIMFAGFL